jgi:hypothetical protein
VAETPFAIESDGCVFCGGKPLTNEHVWPDWIGRLLYGYPKGGRAPAAPHRRSSSLRHEPTGVWTAPSFSQKASIVCADCNHGWMSDLEVAVEPILRPMLVPQGKVVLRESDQAVLARWITKTAMVFQHTTPRRPIPPNQFRYLFDHRRPPPSCQLWVGIRSAEDGVVLSGLQTARIKVPTSEGQGVFHRGYLVTLGIAGFVGQLLGNDLPRFDFDWGHQGEFAAAVEPIWPVIEPIEWPPNKLVRSVNDFANDPAFGEHLTRSLGARGITLVTVEPE